MQIIKVLVPKIGLFPLDYQLIEDVTLLVGDLIVVPFRNQNITGIVWQINCFSSYKNLKKIDLSLTNKINNQYQNIGSINIQLIQKASKYYLAPLGSVAKLLLPFDINTKKTKKKLSQPDIIDVIPENFPLPKLSEEQVIALDKIKSTKKPILLKGITGSGKTEVYFYLVAEALKKGKQALIMLPEISLSSQIIKRFIDRFGFKPTIWNSKQTKSYKEKVFQGILDKTVKVIIGARSALFLPYNDLSLIVIDEEHDPSYKQGEGVLYNARDMAVLKSHLLTSQIVLVSATPSIETICNVKLAKYSMVELKNRFSNASLPKVEIIDMRNVQMKKNNWISKQLIDEMKIVANAGKQSLLFLNRRGYAPLMLCKSCGYKCLCSNCSASMVVHKSKKIMECHHCGKVNKIYDICPECKEKDSLHLYGPGIERIEEEAKKIFPDLKISIISKDQTNKPEQMQNLLHKMETGNIDILIGTQIITKGYHFPKLALVGVIDADLGFVGGDLRSAERTFQLLHQVGGRTGRDKSTKGKVFLQSYCPDNKVLQSLVKGDEEEFINQEISTRKENNMPPFTKMAIISIFGKNSEKTLSIANHIAHQAPPAEARSIFGPAEALIFKLSGKYRYKLLITAKKNFNIQKYISIWLSNCKVPSTFQVKIDIDPYNFY